MEWTDKWPNKEGCYWFYGHPYKGEKEQGRKPELNFVRVQKISNGFIYVREGAFWFKKECDYGLFRKIDAPKLPKLNIQNKSPLTKIIHLYSYVNSCILK